MNLKNLLLENITLESLLNYYEASIQYINVPYRDIRGFVDYYRGIYIIYINKNISDYKKRDTIIHEIAHIELNQLNQVDADLFSFKIDGLEDEADRYVKFLLDEINND